MLPLLRTELAALAPDIIVADTSVTVAALQQATRTVPIVFVRTIDPVGAGFVESLARPGGNTTGFLGFEYATAAKWLELLREIVPSVTRAAVLRRLRGGTADISPRPWSSPVQFMSTRPRRWQ